MQNEENLELENQEEAPEEGQPSKDPEKLLERYKAQVKGSKAEALKLKQQNIEIAASAVESDPKYMKVLVEKDSKFADEVARKFEGYSDAQALMKDFLGGDTNSKTLEERITEQVMSRLWQTTIKTQVEQKFSHLWDDMQKVANTKFEEYRAWRSLNVNQATELADMVTLFLQKDTIAETAKQARVNNMWNLKLWWVSTTHTNSDNSWAWLAWVLWLWHLYTNNK